MDSACAYIRVHNPSPALVGGDIDSQPDIWLNEWKRCLASLAATCVLPERVSEAVVEVIGIDALVFVATLVGLMTGHVTTDPGVGVLIACSASRTPGASTTACMVATVVADRPRMVIGV